MKTQGLAKTTVNFANLPDASFRDPHLLASACDSLRSIHEDRVLELAVAARAAALRLGAVDEIFTRHPNNSGIDLLLRIVTTPGQFGDLKATNGDRQKHPTDLHALEAIAKIGGDYAFEKLLKIAKGGSNLDDCMRIGAGNLLGVVGKEHHFADLVALSQDLKNPACFCSFHALLQACPEKGPPYVIERGRDACLASLEKPLNVELFLIAVHCLDALELKNHLGLHEELRSDPRFRNSDSRISRFLHSMKD